MKYHQGGATFLGMVVILLILGSALYAGIRLVPVYLEYMKVARSLEQVRWKEIEIKKSADGFDMRAAYDAEEPFAANVYLLVRFDKTVTIQQ